MQTPEILLSISREARINCMEQVSAIKGKRNRQNKIFKVKDEFVKLWNLPNDFINLRFMEVPTKRFAKTLNTGEWQRILFITFIEDALEKKLNILINKKNVKRKEPHQEKVEALRNTYDNIEAKIDFESDLQPLMDRLGISEPYRNKGVLKFYVLVDIADTISAGDVRWNINEYLHYVASSEMINKSLKRTEYTKKCSDRRSSVRLDKFLISNRPNTNIDDLDEVKHLGYRFDFRKDKTILVDRDKRNKFKKELKKLGLPSAQKNRAKDIIDEDIYKAWSADDLKALLTKLGGAYGHLFDKSVLNSLAKK